MREVLTEKEVRFIDNLKRSTLKPYSLIIVCLLLLALIVMEVMTNNICSASRLFIVLIMIISFYIVLRKIVKIIDKII